MPAGFGVVLPVYQVALGLILILTVEFTATQRVVEASDPFGGVSRTRKSYAVPHIHVSDAAWLPRCWERLLPPRAVQVAMAASTRVLKLVCQRLGAVRKTRFRIVYFQPFPEG